MIKIIVLSAMAKTKASVEFENFVNNMDISNKVSEH